MNQFLNIAQKMLVKCISMIDSDAQDEHSQISKTLNCILKLPNSPVKHSFLGILIF